MHERQAIKKRVKSLLEGIWLSFYCYPATTGYLFLIISDQQFIDRFSFLGYGTDGTEDADSLDMETGIEVVEEGVLRVLLTGVGVGEHSFASLLSQALTESGQLYSLAEICQISVLRHSANVMSISNWKAIACHLNLYFVPKILIFLISPKKSIS